MDGKTLGLLLAAFLMIIVGANLIISVATQEQGVTQKKTVTSEVHALTCTPDGNVTAETITLTNAPTSWKTTDCPITNLAVKNSTGSAIALTTGYTANLAAGTFTLIDVAANNLALCGGTAAQNSSYVDYTYCGDDYLNSSFGRTAADLVPGFFALAIMAIGVGLLYGILKTEGIINI